MAAELFREGRAFDFEPSVEFSYDTITAEKMAAIGDAGFTRASTGLQVVDKKFLSEMGRASPALERMLSVNAGL